MVSARLPTAQRQRQIAEAALRILAREGARGLTAARLAAEVGIADGTLFRHFRNKDEIVLAAIERFEEELEPTFPPPEGPPVERLRAFFVARLALVRSRPELLQLAFSERLAEAAGEAGAARVQRLVVRSIAFVQAALVEGRAAGSIRRDVPLQAQLWMLLGFVRGAARALPLPLPAGELELASEAPEIVWDALASMLLTHSLDPESPA